MNRDRSRTLTYWIWEREKIRLWKEAHAPRPWTKDAILQEWRFCNVNRCDDTVTRWIFEHVIAPHASSPSLWFNLVIARLVNWPDTLAALGFYEEWDVEHFVRTVANLKGKVWTGAYMIPAGPPGTAKARYLGDETLTSLWNARMTAPFGGTCAAWFAFIERARSMGGFLANQVVTDMKYTPILADASDRETFIVAGPGTQRGLNRLFDHDLKHAWGREEAAVALAELRKMVVAELPDFAGMMRDLNNVANICCEFDKYERVRLGEGKPRARYVPACRG